MAYTHDNPSSKPDQHLDPVKLHERASPLTSLLALIGIVAIILLCGWFAYNYNFSLS